MQTVQVSVKPHLDIYWKESQNLRFQVSAAVNDLNDNQIIITASLTNNHPLSVLEKSKTVTSLERILTKFLFWYSFQNLRICCCCMKDTLLLVSSLIRHYFQFTSLRCINTVIQFTGFLSLWIWLKRWGLSHGLLLSWETYYLSSRKWHCHWSRKKIFTNGYLASTETLLNLLFIKQTKQVTQYKLHVELFGIKKRCRTFWNHVYLEGNKTKMFA